MGNVQAASRSLPLSKHNSQLLMFTSYSWKHGGMNSSLTVPDYLTCKVTLTTSIKTLKRQKRSPVLTAGRLSERRQSRLQPMAARVNQFNPAAEGIRRPDIGENRAKPDPAARMVPGQPEYDSGNVRAGGQEVEKNMAVFNPSLLPDPPLWIARFISGHLKTLPFSTEDDALLAWLRTLKDPFLRAARQVKPRSAHVQKKKMTNAERFRLQLPPVAPKAIRERANKPAPFRIPGIEYSDEEIAAMGWQHQDHDGEVVDDLTIGDSRIWLSVLLAAMDSQKKAEDIRKDVLESIWQLLDFVAEKQEEQARMHEKNKARLKAAEDALTPQKVHGAKGFAKPAQKVPAVKAGGAVPKAAPVAPINRADGEIVKGQAIPDAQSHQPHLQQHPNVPNNEILHLDKGGKGAQAQLKLPLVRGNAKGPQAGKANQGADRGSQNTPPANGRPAVDAGHKPQIPGLKQAADSHATNLDTGVLSGLRAMLDAKEKELADLRMHIEALGKHWQDVVPVKVGSSPSELAQDGDSQEPFAPEQASLDPFEEHLRLAKAKQADLNEKKVQPEYSLLEREDVLAGAGAINAGKGKLIPGGVQFVKPGPRE